MYETRAHHRGILKIVFSDCDRCGSFGVAGGTGFFVSRDGTSAPREARAQYDSAKFFVVELLLASGAEPLGAWVDTIVFLIQRVRWAAFIKHLVGVGLNYSRSAVQIYRGYWPKHASDLRAALVARLALLSLSRQCAPSD